MHGFPHSFGREWKTKLIRIVAYNREGEYLSRFRGENLADIGLLLHEQGVDPAGGILAGPAIREHKLALALPQHTCRPTMLVPRKSALLQHLSCNRRVVQSIPHLSEIRHKSHVDLRASRYPMVNTAGVLGSREETEVAAWKNVFLCGVGIMRFNVLVPLAAG